MESADQKNEEAAKQVYVNLPYVPVFRALSRRAARLTNMSRYFHF